MTDTTSTVASTAGAEQIAFWILGPLALLGAVGMVLSRGAVHSALWLVLTMLCLGCAYLVQQAEFLGFVQIIVYTGAIMMLFLFVLMLTGRDAGDSVFEVLRGQRVAAALVGIALVALLTTGLLRALDALPTVGLDEALALRGAVGSIAELVFTDFLFPFELTSALLITAAVGAMVLTHVEKSTLARTRQPERVRARMASGRMSPLPGPGVFATSSSNATPALLPDGSVAPGSVSALVERSESDRVTRRFRGHQSLVPLGGEPPSTSTDAQPPPSRQPGPGLAAAGAGVPRPDDPSADPAPTAPPDTSDASGATAGSNPFGGAAGLPARTGSSAREPR
ncbi:NADH-quinone oxidoreductase subunit J [Nakamurella leprariae]|uniref:NADH-quinone oxidoreductase subunit J n=1 Tax=Nakamurella leprariae TaxID=2803911 RepID=UPI0038B2427A